MTNAFSDFAETMSRPQRRATSRDTAVSSCRRSGGGEDARLIAALAFQKGQM